MATAPTSTTYSIPDLEVFGGHAVSDHTSFVSHRVQLNPASNSGDSDTRQIIQVQEYSISREINASENTVEDEDDKSVPKKPVWY